MKRAAPPKPTLLAGALAADWAGCLSVLLDAWRDARDAALAEAIELASKRARGLEVAPREVAQRIASATDRDVGPIIAVIRRQLRTQPSFVRHAIELAKARSPDPRIAALLAEVFEHAPYRGDHGPLDRRVVDALAAIDDPRFRGLICDEAEAYRARRGRLVRRRGQIDHLIAVAAKLAARPPPPSVTIDRELLELLAREPVHAELSELWRAVYADPSEIARPWTTLGLYGLHANTFELLADARANFARLVELDLASTTANPAILAVLAETPLVAQLQRVRIVVPARALATLNAFAGTTLRELDVVPAYSFPPLCEGPIARFARRELELIARTPRDVRYLLAVLRALEVGAITAAKITAPPKTDTRALVAELQRLQVTS